MKASSANGCLMAYFQSQMEMEKEQMILSSVKYNQIPSTHCTSVARWILFHSGGADWRSYAGLVKWWRGGIGLIRNRKNAVCPCVAHLILNSVYFKLFHIFSVRILQIFVCTTHSFFFGSCWGEFEGFRMWVGGSWTFSNWRSMRGSLRFVGYAH